MADLKDFEVPEMRLVDGSIDLDDKESPLEDDEKDGNEEKVVPASKKFSWTKEDEVELLQEVILVEPFKLRKGEIGTSWNDIAKRSTKKYTGRTAQKHFNTLLQEYKLKKSRQLKETGTEAEVTKQEELLEDILERMETTSTKGMKAKIEAEQKEKGSLLREAAMTGMSPEPSPGTSSKKRRVSGKEDRLLDIMERRLELDERKVALEEKKYEMLFNKKE